MRIGGYVKVAKALEASPIFAHLIPLIVKGTEVDILLRLSANSQSIEEFSISLGLRKSAVEREIYGLY